MQDPHTTCWTLIRTAAAGSSAARDRFAHVYLPIVRAYLATRWQDPTQGLDPEDAAQDVFVECFKAGGLLAKVEPDRPGGFRAFLLGAARNVARRHEKRVRPTNPLPAGLQADDTGPAKAFDREWARALCREAALAQEEAASRSGPAAVRRVRLLRLRFHDGLPIREIARRLGEDPDRLHREYAVARDEFQAALRAVVAFHHPEATAGEIDRECDELTGLLG